MSSFSTDAILLKKIEYGDYDLILTFFSRARGKISVMAKNAKKSIKRFSGALDLFSVHHIECTYPKKKKDALLVLTHAELETGFSKIRTDVIKTGYASYWVEIIYSWLEEKKQQESLYELLWFSLDALNSGSIKKETLSLLFQIRFMSISGFSPNISFCSTCGKHLDEISQKKINFNYQAGKICCATCIKKPIQFGMNVTKGTLKQLFWINNNEMTRADRIKLSPIAVREGEVLLESFIPFHIGRDFKSLKFLRRVRNT